MIPRRRKKEPMGVKEPSVIRCPAHLQHVRGFACLIEGKSGHICEGKIEAHHVREGSNGGMGLKPDDSDVVPLCAFAHRLGHSIGWITFQQRYGVRLDEIAAELWKRSAAGIRYRARNP